LELYLDFGKKIQKRTYQEVDPAMKVFVLVFCVALVFWLNVIVFLAYPTQWNGLSTPRPLATTTTITITTTETQTTSYKKDDISGFFPDPNVTEKDIIYMLSATEKTRHLINYNKVTGIFQREGVVAVFNVLDPEVVTRHYNLAVEQYEFLLGRVKKLGIDPAKVWSREFAARPGNRFDMTFNIHDHLFTTITQDLNLKEVINMILGHKHKILRVGIMLALPNSTAQRFHADGPPLFPKNPWNNVGNSSLCCQCLCAFGKLD